MELDALEPRLAGAPRRLDKIADEASNFRIGHPPRHDLGDWIVDGGRGDGHAAAQTLLGLAPGMGDLQEDAAREAVNRLGDPSQPGDEAVVVDGELSRAGLSRGLDKGVPGDDEPDLSVGQAGIEL